MEKRENQRIAITKRLLKEGLLKLMESKSIQNITVKELCETAQINRSTFYNHYGCPADVLKEMELEVISDLEQMQSKETTIQKRTVQKRMEAFCSYLFEHRELSKLLFRDSDTNSEFPSLLFNATHVISIYEQELSYIDDDESRKLIITFLTNGTYHMIRQWLLCDIMKTPKEMSELVFLVSKQWSEQIADKKQQG
ncbi:MAG: TetR/AcrR family transcriptional regulator [Eubacterium sp.]